jgi:hypothetical protein
MTTKYENGLVVGEWSLAPCCVFGGWSWGQVRWVRRESGWEDQWEPSGDATVYPTREAALEASARQADVRDVVEHRDQHDQDEDHRHD